MRDIYEYIAVRLPEMSKSQKKIANYILSNKSSVSFLNVSQLAKLTEASEASIVRFSTFLGFEGYPQLRQQLQQATQKQLTSQERLALSYQVYDSTEKGIIEVFQDDIKNIQSTLDNLDIDTFMQIISVLAESRRIFIVAGRSAASLGTFLFYYLDMIGGNVSFIKDFNGTDSKLENVSKEDVLIGISFSKYTKSTVQVLKYAHSKNCITIAITDNHLSPLVPYASYSLYTETKMPTFIDSFVAPLTLINAIITVLGKKMNISIENRLAQLDEMWQQFDIFQ